MAPIVTNRRKLSPSIGRKLSRRENPEDCELGTVISEHARELSIPLDSDMDISDEFISQMREVFKEFDKVKARKRISLILMVADVHQRLVYIVA